MFYVAAYQDVEIQEKLGRGEFSTVYRANWNDKTIAVKKYSSPEDVFHLDRTFNNLLHVDNDYILKLYGRTDIPGLNRTESLLLIEYADCGSLHDQIYRPMRRYNPRDALNWMYQCAKGMAFLHAMQPVPLVHYNLRPTMLFLTDYFQRLKISNKTINPMHPDRFWGPYDAPEGMRNKHNKEKFDVYSFGVVLWEVLSQQRPISWENLEFIQTLSSNLVKSCLNFNPAMRPSMETIITSLSSYMGQIHSFDIQDIKLGEVIGSGAYGTVFKAHSRGNQFAVKKYKFQEKNAMTDLKREVKYLSQVNHKNIIKLFGLMRHTGFKIKIVMEFADCGTLYDYLHKGEKEKRSYTYLAALNWMCQLAQGLEYLHGIKPEAIIHRDIKTKNLLLSNNYRTLKIGDFGTVREMASVMTYHVGTAQYIAPEVFSEAKKYTEKSDVYSFGIVLWEVMSQRIPFYHLGNSLYQTITFQVSQGKRPDINDIKDYPNRGLLISIIENCWSVEPEKRYTMAELVLKLGIDLNSSDFIRFDIKQLAETSDSDYGNLF